MTRNVNPFGQTACKLGTDEFQTNSKAADNIRLKEIKKKKGFVR